jgi:hypothetical protein
LTLAFVDETADIKLGKLRKLLAKEGVTVGYGALWRFFDPRKITREKRQRTPPSRTGRMS